MDGDLEGVLAGVPKGEYGPDHGAHLLEQYKLYVQMADKISERRQAANAFFLTINSAIVSILAIAWPRLDDPLRVGWHILVGVCGLVLSYSWYHLIRSYRDLNSGKFRVVHAIEKMLPIRPYDAEWTAVGRGENSKLYLPFTHIETKVPWVFLVIYVGLIGITVAGLIWRA